MESNYSPIGVFDSGYGGLTILKEIRRALPQYDYLYLGDSARAPYGNRSFEIVYQFTLEAVNELFRRGCHLVILACNTASAKALRSIQQRDLPNIDGGRRRVLGVIRPTVEAIGQVSRNGHVGLLATRGTVMSRSYELEIEKLWPDFQTTSHACPMWAPLVENGEAHGDGTDYFVRRDIQTLLSMDSQIDTVILGCTHYPLLIDKIKAALPQNVAPLCQGEIVADSLSDYLRRHPEIEAECSKNGSMKYLTTETPSNFNAMASLFMGEDVDAQNISISQ